MLKQHIGEILFRGTRWKLATVLLTLIKPAVMFAVFLPGSALLLPGLIRGVSHSTDPVIVRIRIASWAFLLAGVVLFMISPVRNTRYYLPLVTPMAVLAGMYVETFRLRAPGLAAKLPWPKIAADPAVWMVFVGCIYWLVLVSCVEPRRERSNSLRDLATSFEGQVQRGEPLYVDTSDSHSALFWYLNCPGRVWRIDQPLPPPPACVLLVDKQIDAAKGIRDGGLAVIREGRDHDKHRYVLCRVNSGSPVGHSESKPAQ